MKLGDESQVRNLALERGFDLIRSREHPALENGHALYRVILPGHNTTVFPTGKEVHGASLNDVKDWLGQPWE
jgi:hypothetical protein